MSTFHHISPTGWLIIIVFSTLGAVILYLLYQNKKRKKNLLKSTKKNPLELLDKKFENCSFEIGVANLVTIGESGFLPEGVEPGDSFYASFKGFDQQPKQGEFIKIKRIKKTNNFSCEKITQKEFEMDFFH